MAGRGAWSALALDRRGEELQTPAEFVADSAHSGSEPWENSFLEVMPRDLWVLAIKQAEHAQDGVIVRMQERSGAPTQATIKSNVLGLDYATSLTPWEIKTLLIKPVQGSCPEVREVSLLEA